LNGNVETNMYFELKDATANILARSRRHGELCDLPLDLISSEAEAYEIQAAAQDALGFERKGYAIVGSSDGARRTLGMTKPVFSEIPGASFLSRATEFHLPQGVIGVQCEFLFTMLRPYPDGGESIDLASVADAVITCRPAIGILGRRTRRPFAGQNAAIADFGFHVATLYGNHVKDFALSELPDIEVTTFLFKETVLMGRATSVMGNPLNAVAWLARELQAVGRCLGPNDIVATGSCTTILQVSPRQHLAVDFGPLGQIDCIFS
jgi:2-keto-4-pentenoate hydratase